MKARQMNLYSFERGDHGLSNESKIVQIESLIAEQIRSIHLFSMFEFDY